MARLTLPACRPDRQRDLHLPGAHGHALGVLAAQLQHHDADPVPQLGRDDVTQHAGRVADEVELPHPEALDRPDRAAGADPVTYGALPGAEQERRARVHVRCPGRPGVVPVVVDGVEVPVAACGHHQPVDRQRIRHLSDGLTRLHVLEVALPGAHPASPSHPPAGRGTYAKATERMRATTSPVPVTMSLSKVRNAPRPTEVSFGTQASSLRPRRPIRSPTVTGRTKSISSPVAKNPVVLGAGPWSG